jgi:hypothetical protein
MNIKNIAVLSPVDMYNKEEQATYINKKGVILVEFEDNSRRYLDISNRVDITDYEEWEVVLNKKSKMKYIFEGDKEYYNSMC